jgi:hypothetical protein
MPMIYRDEKQALRPGIERMLEGINLLDAAITARVEHPEEWRWSHRQEIVNLQADLVRLRLRLTTLYSEVW